MSDTPRTDKFCAELNGNVLEISGCAQHLASFTRQLERELNAANAVIATLQTTIESRAVEILKEG